MEMNSTAIDIEKALPVQAVRSGAVIAKDGAVTFGWELEFPVAGSVSQDDYDDMSSVFMSAYRGLPDWTVVHRQDRYTMDTYSHPSTGDYLDDAYYSHFEGRRHPVHHHYLFITRNLFQRNSQSVLKPHRSSSAFGKTKRLDLSRLSTDDLAEFHAQAMDFVSVITGTGRIKARPLSDDELQGVPLVSPGLIQEHLMMGEKSLLMGELRQEGGHALEVHGRRLFGYSLHKAKDLPTEISNTGRIDALSSAVSDVYMSLCAPIGILLDCEHEVNSYVIVPNQQEALRKMDARRKRMNAQDSNAENRVNAEDLQTYIDDVHRESKFTVFTHADIFVWGAPKDELELRGRVSAGLSRMGVTAVRVERDLPVLFFSAVPGGACELTEDNYMTNELGMATCLSGYETYQKDIPGGCFHVCDKARNFPLVIDTQREAYARGWITSYNAICLGASGTGKSFFMNSYLSGLYYRGEQVFIIDVGDSYEGLCRVINEESGGRDGHYHSWSVEHPFSFSPFKGFRGDGTADDPGWLSTVETSDGTQERRVRQDEPGVSFILSFLKTAFDPEGGWTTERANILSSMVEGFLLDYDGKGGEGDPIFDDFFRYVNDVVAPMVNYVSPYEAIPDGETPEEARSRRGKLTRDLRKHCWYIGSARVRRSDFDVDRFIIALESYSSSGRFGFLLNARAEGDLFSSRFAVFEVDDLQNVDDGTKDKKFYSICILCIINAFDRRMRQDVSTFKNLVIEEAWSAISNESMAPYLRGLWKTSRKFSTSAMVVTQEIDDLSVGVVKDTIVANSPVKFLLDQSNNMNRFDKVQETFALTEKEKGLVLTMNRDKDPRYRSKDVFIKLGDRQSAVYSNEVSPRQALVYESEKSKKAELFRLAEEMGSIRRAADSIAERMARRRQ